MADDYLGVPSVEILVKSVSGEEAVIKRVPVENCVKSEWFLQWARVHRHSGHGSTTSSFSPFQKSSSLTMEPPAGVRFNVLCRFLDIMSLRPFDEAAVLRLVGDDLLEFVSLSVAIDYEPFSRLAAACIGENISHENLAHICAGLFRLDLLSPRRSDQQDRDFWSSVSVCGDYEDLYARVIGFMKRRFFHREVDSWILETPMASDKDIDLKLEEHGVYDSDEFRLIPIPVVLQCLGVDFAERSYRDHLSGKHVVSVRMPGHEQSNDDGEHHGWKATTTASVLDEPCYAWRVWAVYLQKRIETTLNLDRTILKDLLRATTNDDLDSLEFSCEREMQYCLTLHDRRYPSRFLNGGAVRCRRVPRYHFARCTTRFSWRLAGEQDPTPIVALKFPDLSPFTVTIHCERSQHRPTSSVSLTYSIEESAEQRSRHPVFLFFSGTILSGEDVSGPLQVDLPERGICFERAENYRSLVHEEIEVANDDSGDTAYVGVSLTILVTDKNVVNDKEERECFFRSFYGLLTGETRSCPASPTKQLSQQRRRRCNSFPSQEDPLSREEEDREEETISSTQEEGEEEDALDDQRQREDEKRVHALVNRRIRAVSSQMEQYKQKMRHLERAVTRLKQFKKLVAKAKFVKTHGRIPPPEYLSLIVSSENEIPPPLLN